MLSADAAQAWSAQALQHVRGEIDAALAARTLAGAHVAILVVDSANGSVVYARRPDDAMVPASTLKLAVGSAAMSALGPEFTFDTVVESAGTIDGDTLKGDLFLHGGGDAQLSDGDLDAAAATLESKGVRHIAGAVVGDAARYDASHYPPGWSVDDLPYDYAAVPSALSLDDNVVHVQIAPGSRVGASGTLALPKNLPASFTIVNDVLTGSRGSADTTDLARPWNAPETTRIFGAYPLGAGLSDAVDLAVPDPSAFALDAFASALARHGIAIDGGTRSGYVPAAASILWWHHSAPLAQVIAECWQPSNNLLAEQMLEELGFQATQAGQPASGDTRALGIAAERSWLQSIGVDPATVSLSDGSGLSTYDRITPRALVAILTSDWNSQQRDAFVNALPEAGVRGTLQNTFAGTPLQGAVFAKTGSEDHVRTLAGYLRTRKHGTAIFAVLINNWMDTSTDAGANMTAARSAILTALLDG